jgi:hypothetical protein
MSIQLDGWLLEYEWVCMIVSWNYYPNSFGVWQWWVNNYQALNANTIHNNFPLPRVDEILAVCGKGKIFGKVDMTNSFFQTHIHPDDIHLTAIRTPWGLYKWTVMPQGGCNAPSTHQCYMTDALWELIGKICHVYLDNIIIWLQTVEEHERNCEDALQKANLFCNEQKSNLFATELIFLGYVISGNGIKPNPCKTDQITNWQHPTMARSLHSPWYSDRSPIGLLGLLGLS